MLKNSWISKTLIKMENFIALYEAQRASLFKEII